MGKLLTGIKGPEDIKKMDVSQLESLAQEIREEIIDRVSQNGGHLGPNLGVVELTLALHHTFSTPDDKIVWDVGHQAYVHKLLTGRQKEFATLRQFKGMSGYPKITESAHDAFGVGHASISISAALGLALGRDCQKAKNHVVAVIGDGSLTGGMAYEALNYAGHTKTNLMVVLNDNEMSIDRNVGALSHNLSRVRLDPNYAKIKQEVESFLKKVPAIGMGMAKNLEWLKERIKYLVVPGAFFEELGFRYFGPVDGHDLPALMEIFEKSRDLEGPIFIHVLTQKGRGYQPAVKNASNFHGVGPFCIETGEASKGSKPSYTSIFGETLLGLAEKDEKIVAITAAMPDGTGLRKFSQKYPDRYFDVGIAEGNAVTMSAGLSVAGQKPVVAIYSSFMQRAYDSLIHDVCLQKLPVIFALDRAGLVGEDGPTHHGVFDLSFLRNVPDLTVMAPSDGEELKKMLTWATEQGKPIAIRYPRGDAAESLQEKAEAIRDGKGRIFTIGKDVNLLAIGSMVKPAMEAAEKLALEGIDCGVADLRFVKPLDEELIRILLAAAPNLVTIEENALIGGVGSGVLELIQDKEIKMKKLARLGIPDQFIEHGSRNQLLELVGLNGDGIAKKVTDMLKG